MRLAQSLLAAAVLYGWTMAVAVGQDSDAQPSKTEQELRAVGEAYAEAMNAGDVEAVVAFWTADADYLADTGERVVGYDALKQMFTQYLGESQGKTFAYEILSIRDVAPGVAIEDGVAKVFNAEHPESGVATRYTAVWRRDGEKWLLSNVRDLGQEGGNARSDRLPGGLDWLIGEWESATEDIAIRLSCAPALDHSFLQQTYVVQPRDGERFTVVTLIGWDPTNEQIRSWYFDSRGGFGDGYWTATDQGWSISSTGVIADGRMGTATNLWGFVDGDHLVWQSRNRQLEGQPLPTTEVEFTRVGSAPPPPQQ